MWLAAFSLCMLYILGKELGICLQTKRVTGRLPTMLPIQLTLLTVKLRCSRHIAATLMKFLHREFAQAHVKLPVIDDDQELIHARRHMGQYR